MVLSLNSQEGYVGGSLLFPATPVPQICHYHQIPVPLPRLHYELASKYLCT